MTDGPGDAAPQLSKVVAGLVPCSRSKAEQLIAEGWVRVDGAVVHAPQLRVAATQRVEVDPQATLQGQVRVTVLLHKPAGTTVDDLRALFRNEHRWPDDASGLRRTRSHEAGLVPLLPLPDAASGLAVFSQAPGVVRRLQEDAALIEQELNVDVTGSVAPGGLERLARGGLAHAGKVLPPLRVSWQSEARLRFAMKGVAPEWIPWMCEQIGLSVTGIKRIRIGRVAMAGLPAGQWRYLLPGERF